MNIKQLQRQPDRVHANLRELADGRLVTTTGCKILIPSRFEGRGLADIGIDTHIAGVACVVVDDLYYGVLLRCAKMKIEPTSTIKIKIEDEEYYEFSFDPGATVVSSVNLVKTDTLVYKIYEEIMAKGHVPWYLEYMDLARIFDTAKEAAGANVGQYQEVTELIVSILARNALDRHQYYRQSVQSLEEVKTKPPVFVAMRSVTYQSTNTLNKLAGSYAKEGLISALVHPTDRVERIEDLLRR